MIHICRGYFFCACETPRSSRFAPQYWQNRFLPTPRRFFFTWVMKESQVLTVQKLMCIMMILSLILIYWHLPRGISIHFSFIETYIKSPEIPGHVLFEPAIWNKSQVIILEIYHEPPSVSELLKNSSQTQTKFCRMISIASAQMGLNRSQHELFHRSLKQYLGSFDLSIPGYTLGCPLPSSEHKHRHLFCRWYLFPFNYLLGRGATQAIPRTKACETTWFSRRPGSRKQRCHLHSHGLFKG